MTTINLKDFYAWYTHDEYIEVSDEVAAELKAAQNERWEKQYPYKVCKKKVYMTPSAAETQGLVRADKHPKSTRYGRQNPISERWNSEEQLAAWRAAWGLTCPIAIWNAPGGKNALTIAATPHGGWMRSLLCCSAPSRKRLDCSERMRRIGRRGR